MNYHNVHPALVVLTRLLGRHGPALLRRLASLGRWLPQVTNAVRGNKSFTADLYPLGFAGAVRHLRSTQQFFADAAAGTLPAVSIVDPDFGLYSEENPQDIAHGEAFAAAVVNAVMHGPAWESTLLVWTYDEHGGYYDHVPPPAAVAPDDVPARNWQLSRPWARWLLGLLTPRQLARLENADDGPVDLRPLRVPGARGDRLAVRAAGLRAARRARPHLGAQADRGEVEPAAAHPPGRRRRLAARRARPGRAARVPDPPGPGRRERRILQAHDQGADPAPCARFLTPRRH